MLISEYTGQKWEYFTFRIKASDNDETHITSELYDSQHIIYDYPLTDTLNELGEDGWELVGMSPLREKFDKDAIGGSDEGCKEYEIEYVFKRPKED